jgi:hypothetical protein
MPTNAAPPAMLGTTPTDLAHARGNLPAREGWAVSEERCDDGTAYILAEDPHRLPWMVERVVSHRVV